MICRTSWNSPKTLHSMRAGIALGSNLGDRLAHLNEAHRLLQDLHNGSGPFLSSKIYESTPVDCPQNSPLFLNAAIELSTDLPPLDLLAKLQAIETQSGRPLTRGFHEPRTLDLDLLYLGNLRMSHNLLTLPHPRISERLFVLKPLNDICPNRQIACSERLVRDARDVLELSPDSDCTVNFVSYFQQAT